MLFLQMLVLQRLNSHWKTTAFCDDRFILGAGLFFVFGLLPRPCNVYAHLLCATPKLCFSVCVFNFGDLIAYGSCLFVLLTFAASVRLNF